MLSFAQLVKEWRSKTYEYLPHFFKLQARERLLIHREQYLYYEKVKANAGRCQYFVASPFFAITSWILLGIDSTISSSSFWVREAQTSRNTAFNSSRVFRWTCCTRVFIFCQTNSMMLRSGELHGHSKTFHSIPFHSLLFQVLGCLIGAMGWCKVMLEHKVIISKEFIYRWKQVSI